MAAIVVVFNVPNGNKACSNPGHGSKLRGQELPPDLIPVAQANGTIFLR
jgi:hypothetical protein